MELTRKPSLVFYLQGIAAYETMIPIISELFKIDRTAIRIFTNGSVLRREPRLAEVLKPFRTAVRVFPNKLLRYFPWLWLMKGDIAVLLTDPDRTNTPLRRILSHIKRKEICSIFLQHGVSQPFVNKGDGPFPYYSDLILLYEPLANSNLFTTKQNARIVSVGFLKRPILAPLSPDLYSKEFSEKILSFSSRLLFCQSFRKFRHDRRAYEARIEGYFEMLSRFAGRNPTSLIIIRSHRGISDKMYDSYEQKISRSYDNVVLINKTSNAFVSRNLIDVLALSTAVLSTLSTAILDSVYMRIPTAVMYEDGGFFPHLPRVNNLQQLEKFSNEKVLIGVDATIAHYGNIDSNISDCARLISNFYEHKLASHD